MKAILPILAAMLLPSCATLSVQDRAANMQGTPAEPGPVDYIAAAFVDVITAPFQVAAVLVGAAIFNHEMHK